MPDKEEQIVMLWRKTWGRIPSFPERDETQKLLDKFGYDKTYEIMYEAQLLGFKKIRTLVNALDEEGNIKPKGQENKAILGQKDTEWKEVIKDAEKKERWRPNNRGNK